MDFGTCPVLVDCQIEQRAWVVPKLPVIEMMALLHIKRYGVSNDGSNDRNTGGVKQLLQTYLKHPVFLALLNYDQHDNTHIMRELAVSMNDMLAFAEGSVRSQMRFSPLGLVREVIYGMDLHNLAMRHHEQTVRKAHLRARTIGRRSFSQSRCLH